MIRYSMLPNIMAHSFRVMEVAIAIVDNLKIDVQINREIVMAAALLHDITKTRSLITRERHDTSGAVLLREMGYTDVADIVEQHVILNNFDPQGALEEKEIVFYADKRVMHDQVVTLEERVEDLLHRYGKTEEIRRRIIQNLNSVYAIETKIAGLMTVDLSHAIHAVASSAGDSVVKNSDGCTGDYA
jgi:putative nucleotidyltransferase with HDIG domain